MSETPKFPGPVDNDPTRSDPYHWVETEAEKALRKVLDEESLLFGDVHHFDTTILPLDVQLDDPDTAKATSLREALGIPEDSDATHVRMPSYERTNHSIHRESVDSAGFSVSLISKQRYYQGDAVEPHRFSINVGTLESNTGLGMEIVVPSRGMKGHPLDPQETTPPHLNLVLWGDGDMSGVFHTVMAKLEADDEPNKDRYMRFIEVSQRLFGQMRQLPGRHELTEQAMDDARLLALIWFEEYPHTELRNPT